MVLPRHRLPRVRARPDRRVLRDPHLSPGSAMDFHCGVWRGLRRRRRRRIPSPVPIHLRRERSFREDPDDSPRSRSHAGAGPFCESNITVSFFVPYVPGESDVQADAATDGPGGVRGDGRGRLRRLCRSFGGYADQSAIADTRSRVTGAAQGWNPGEDGPFLFRGVRQSFQGAEEAQRSVVRGRDRRGDAESSAAIVLASYR